jgi:ParB family chromosome partitioning protein
MADFVHVSRLKPHPSNVRESLGDLTDLAASIRVHGILQPIVISPDHVVLAGHRRLAAARLARLDMVPVTVRPDADALEVMLVENCQRSDLTAIEKAEAMGTLRQRGMIASQIATRTGLAVSTISYYLSLLDLDEGTRDRVARGTVKVGDAMAAVRQSRKQQRGGPAGRAAARVEAPWFSGLHALAEPARVRCELAGHAGPKVGRQQGAPYPGACGECWETVIREDERTRMRGRVAGSEGGLFRAPDLAGAR